VYQDEKRVDFYWWNRPDEERHVDARFDGAVTIPGIDVLLPLIEIFEGIEIDPAPASYGESDGGEATSI